MIGAEKIAAVRALADRDGFIEPSDVVAAAREPGHILHDEFEWDIATAAQSHWIDRARQLIRFVKVEIMVDHKLVRSVAYVADPNRPPKSRRYIDLTVAASRRAMAEKVLTDELRRIVDAIRRAREVAAVLGLSAQLESLLDDVSNMADAVERKAKRAKKKQAPSRRKRGGSTRPEARA